jgi:hypothetical protein
MRARRLLSLLAAVVLGTSLGACGSDSHAEVKLKDTDCTRKMAALGFKPDTPIGRAEIQNCERLQHDRQTAIDRASGGQTDDGATTTADAQQTTAATGSPATSITELANRYHFTIRQAGGYRFSGRFVFGDPQHIGDTAVTDGRHSFAAADGCSDIDNDSDAVVPAAVTVRNDTPDFAAQATFFFHGFGSAGMPDGLVVEPSFLLGSASCQSPFDAGESTGFMTGDLQPEQSQTTLILLYVKQFYSPDDPDGDLPQLAKSPVMFGSAGNQFTLMREAGPKPTANGYLGSLVPLV